MLSDRRMKCWEGIVLMEPGTLLHLHGKSRTDSLFYEKRGELTAPTTSLRSRCESLLLPRGDQPSTIISDAGDILRTLMGRVQPLTDYHVEIQILMHFLS